MTDIAVHDTPINLTVSRRIMRIAIASQEADPRGQPHRLGVPLASGLVSDCGLLRLLNRDDGKPVAMQAKPLVKWPDGSLKWVLLDWLGDGQELDVAVAGNDAGELSSVKRPVAVQETVGEVVVQSSERDFRFNVGGDLSAAFDLSVEDEQGNALTPTIQELSVIDSGPIRASVRIQGTLKHGNRASRLEWTAEGHFFANQPLQRWAFTIRNPQAAKHPGGIWELGDANSILIREVSIKVRAGGHCETVSLSTDASEPFKSYRSVVLDQVSSGGDNWQAANHVDRNREVNLPFRGFQVDADGETSHGFRADPLLTLQDGTHAVLGIYPEKFWQNFPKRISASGDELTLDLFPRSEDQLHELQGGEQKTHLFWIGAGEAASAMSMKQLRHKAVPRISAEAFAETNVVHWVTPLDDEDESYRTLVDQAVEGDNSFFAKREQIDQYGWRHFGDAYGDHEAAFAVPNPPLISHWNNQYDLVFGLGVRYLRGGDARWFDLMEDMAWHVADIDIYHTDEDKLGYNHGLFWHTVHYVDAAKANHRSYPSGTVGGGPCAEHSYARGLMLYYCLTGESAIRDAVVELGEWILNLEDGSKTPFRWLARGETGLSSASGAASYHGPGRGPGNASETLLTAFELTGRREFLDQVEKLMRRCVHPEEDLDALNLLDAERKWFYTLYLQALGRYLEVKAELNEFDDAHTYGRETLLHFARWMAEQEYPYLEKPEILEYPTETWAAQDMRKSEVLHFASRHARDAERNLFLGRAKFFYDYAVSKLASMETRHFCRPIALMLGSGFSYEAFREAAEPATLSTKKQSLSRWPKSTSFTPQKQIAIARAKKLLLAVSTVLTATALGMLTWLIWV